MPNSLNNTLSIDAAAHGLAAVMIATSAQAQSVGIPIPPNLAFPEEGAFEDKPNGCFLFICPAEPLVTKNAIFVAADKIGDQS